jgi:hypothetical protein
MEKMKEEEKKEKIKIKTKVKSQAAMEYLMTYGWAILIISLALGVLYSLGVLNPKNFLPRVSPGSCFVFRPNGPGTTDMLSLQGTCGYLPMYVASFDGVDDYVNIPNTPSLQITGDLTILLWTWRRTSTTRDTPIWKHYNYEFDVTYEIDGSVKFYHGDGAWESVVALPADSIKTGVWQHIAIVRTATPKEVKAYLNGNLVKTSSYTKTPIASTYPVQIGSRASGTSEQFDGVIAEVMIYNTALSQQEIQYLYQQGLGGGPIHLQNLVGWWPLNGDAKDYSGNNNHGTIYGGVSFIQNYNPP